jgi:hypothetical protein
VRDSYYEHNFVEHLIDQSVWIRLQEQATSDVVHRTAHERVPFQQLDRRINPSLKALSGRWVEVLEP